MTCYIIKMLYNKTCRNDEFCTFRMLSSSGFLFLGRNNSPIPQTYVEELLIGLVLLTIFFLSWQCGVWETLLTALEILIRVHHPHQVFNIRQFLKAEVVHHFLLTCQVLQVHHQPPGQR